MSPLRSAKSAQTDPHSWQLPSSYSTGTKERTPTVIPDPAALQDAYLPGDPAVDDDQASILRRYPHTGHAAVHLALLECFYKLRLDAGESKFGQHDYHPPSYEKKPADETNSKAQAWDLLVRVAVDRFAIWWSNIGLVLQHASAYSHRAGPQAAVQLTKAYLPPMDVLLVWYAWMLNSDAYRAACRARQAEVPGLQRLSFPWPAIRDVIDLDTMRYRLQPDAQTLFVTLSGQRADILTYLREPPAYADEAEPLPVGVDLFAEVNQHTSFFEEAHRLLWIRSPALDGSLTRARDEYQGIVLSQEAKLGPVSFGVELLWRTHRLCPSYYALFRPPFRTQDESNAEPDVIEAPCRCWTCERIRDDVPDYHDGKAASLSSSQLRRIQDHLGFYHAVENARKRGALLPTRPKSAAEHKREQLAKERQERVGYLPGPHEYIKVQPDGTRKIKRQNNSFWSSGTSWWWWF